MRRKPNKPIMRAGNPPADATFVAEHPAGWALYARFTAEKDKKNWINCKLVATGDVPHKANFWLSYCLEDERFCLNRDLQALDTLAPDLISWMAVQLADWWQKREPAGGDDLEGMLG